jgi:hypothetical protein
MSFHCIAIIGLRDRPDTRLPRTAGGASPVPFTVWLLDACVLYLHGD